LKKPENILTLEHDRDFLEKSLTKKGFCLNKELGWTALRAKSQKL
jgi:hypothetical protein